LSDYLLTTPAGVKRFRDMGDGTVAEAVSIAAQIIGDAISVGGNGITIAPTITVQAAAYATGNCIGGKITLPNFLRVAGQTSMIGSATLRTVFANAVEVDALIFRADPTASTFTDKAAAILAAADVSKLVRVIQFNSWLSPVGNPSISQIDNINRLVSLASGVDAYMALVAKGSITFAATTDLSFSIENHRN
jgi:hypothetical protein